MNSSQDGRQGLLWLVTRSVAGSAGLLQAVALLHSLLQLTACLQSSAKVSSTVH